MYRLLFLLIFFIISWIQKISYGQKIAACLNTDGCVELFYINNNNDLCHRWQNEPGKSWSDEKVFIASIECVFMEIGPDGFPLLFYIDTDDKLYQSRQNVSTKEWLAGNLFRENVSSISTTKDNEDYIHLFCLLEDHSVKYRKQITSDNWSSEANLISYVEVLAAGCNADGRIEVFYTIEDNVFMHKWQLAPDGEWADAAVFSDPATAITVAVNADGRLEVFFIDSLKRLYHIWQTAPSNGWADDAIFTSAAHLVRAGYNNDGRIELLFTDNNDILMHNWQTAPSNGWGTSEQFGWYATDITAIQNQDQRLEVFYLGTDGLLYHRYQLEPGLFWSSEYPFLAADNPLFSFEDYNEQPSFTHDPDWHINDHCFILSGDDTWHMFGIMYPDPGSSDGTYVNYFGHASANDLMQIPWIEETPPFYETLSDGDVLWAPHIVFHNGLYYMFYCGGGALTSYKICLRTSEDLVSWSDKQVLFQDGYQARDPMVLFVDEIQKWVMYYCATEYSYGGNHVVVCRTSQDLYTWSERQIVYRDLHRGTDYGPTESPFVVNRGDYYYLFIGPRPYDHPSESYPNWEHPGYCGTDVFRSINWDHWTNADFVGWFDAHAPEIIQDNEGQWYASHCGVKQGGLYIRRMTWLDGINSDETHSGEVQHLSLLDQVIPNPLTDHTNIRYYLDRKCYISAEILDLMGKSIKQLTGGDQLPGMYSLEWDGTNSVGKKVPQGIYFCKFIAGEDQETVKLVVLER